ncbi:DUF4247 domain-containing protein [Nocardia sp. NPDC050710]|uniref:DUF4247 domain-containing protein n=1 Tax=Nocardia sp. NPDC050710 TaxID=3157220 RepID=UPI0033CB91D5
MKRLGRTVTGFVAATILPLSIVGCGDDFETARDFVAHKYSRATTLDQINDGRAYTTSQAPASVTSAITGASRPLDNRRAGDRTFLQYRNDIITVSPNGSGSLIVVDQYRNGYNRHQSTVSGWGWANNLPGDQYRSEGGK